jgi:hypothetical protein
MGFIRGIVVIVYLLVGVVVASGHHYLSNLHTVNGIVSAILAVILWPLVLLGVDLHLGGSKGGGKQGAIVALAGIRSIRTTAAGATRPSSSRS